MFHTRKVAIAGPEKLQFGCNALIINVDFKETPTPDILMIYMINNHRAYAREKFSERRRCVTDVFYKNYGLQNICRRKPGFEGFLSGQSVSRKTGNGTQHISSGIS